MAKPEGSLTRVIRFTHPLDRPPTEMLRIEDGLFVELEGERRARLDPRNPRSVGFLRVLDGLRQHRLPVYLEVEPETRTIVRLLIPHVTRVVGIRQIDTGVLAVHFEHSRGRYWLRSDNPDFDELERLLREALRTGEPVVITEDEAHEIIDVRDYRPAPEELQSHSEDGESGRTTARHN